MLIGIISDSHDNLPAIKKAIETLNSRKVNMVIHAGDYVAPFAVRLLMELNCPWIGVFGNNDGERKGLTLISENRIQEAPYELNLGGKSVYIVHDLDMFSLNGSVPDRNIIISGHLHQASVRKTGNQIYINPGELCGYVSGKSTFAILDTEILEAEVIELV